MRKLALVFLVAVMALVSSFEGNATCPLGYSALPAFTYSYPGHTSGGASCTGTAQVLGCYICNPTGPTTDIRIDNIFFSVDCIPDGTMNSFMTNVSAACALFIATNSYCTFPNCPTNVVTAKVESAVCAELTWNASTQILHYSTFSCNQDAICIRQYKICWTGSGFNLTPMGGTKVGTPSCYLTTEPDWHHWDLSVDQDSDCYETACP